MSGFRFSDASALVLIAVANSALQGQSATRDYFDEVPSASRLVSQTPASLRLHLFGDRSAADYRDVSPRDGIDDFRGDRLAALTERFSPILRRNNFSVPRDFRTIVGGLPTLHVDRWTDGVLSSSDSIPRTLAQGRNERAELASGDSMLLALFREFEPRVQAPNVVPAGPRRETILYFDFPGHDEASWRAAYHSSDPTVSTIYAHPFIDERTTGGERRFTLVVQYWFFYPFNDGPNNHEGDWEHINVAITTRAQAVSDSVAPGGNGALSEGEIRHLLDSASGSTVDSLSIAWVAYYFHHSVFLLDYLTPSASSGASQTASGHGAAPPIWEDANFVVSSLQRRQALVGGRLATHPIGHIGGNNRGVDELLTIVPRFGRSYNRNTHGTFPFPATWRTLGALGASEEIAGSVVPKLRESSARSDSLPWYALIDDDQYVTYRRESIVLLPDWERVTHAATDDPDMWREWAWMVLPIRFGFPSSPSPGRGAVSRTDLGNVSMMSITRHDSWNRSTVTSIHHLYRPHVLRVALAPVSPFNGLQNGWGILNAPIALAGLVPGVQVVTAQLLPWITGALGVLGRPPGKTFFVGTLPNRFTSFGAGRFVGFGGDGFARLLPREEDDSVAAFLARGAVRGARIDHRSYLRRPNDGWRIWLLLHYGDRFAIENTISRDTTSLSYGIAADDGNRIATVRGKMASWQASGGVRLSRRLAGNQLRGYARAGYIWNWYEIFDATLDGVTLATTRTSGGHSPSLRPSKTWWPNSMYGGAGVEWFAPRRAWILGRLGYGVSTELSLVAYPLRTARCSCVLERGDGAVAVVFGW